VTRRGQEGGRIKIGAACPAKGYEGRRRVSPFLLTVNDDYKTDGHVAKKDQKPYDVLQA